MGFLKDFYAALLDEDKVPSEYTFTEIDPNDKTDEDVKEAGAETITETNTILEDRIHIDRGKLICSYPIFPKKPLRPSWDKYFLDMCDLVATRATCPRKSVGCVITKDNLVISLGYNGSLSGFPHCIDVGCEIEDGHCSTVIHSEANSICAAARKGIALEGATIYCSLQPCWNCFKLIVSSGITEIVYKDSYGNSDRVLLAAQKLKQLNGFVMRQYISFE